MKPYISYLAAALCAVMLTLLSPARADASQYGALAQAISASQAQAAMLLQPVYYGGGDYHDEQKSDDDDGYKQDDYRPEKKYHHGDNDDSYGYRRKHHSGYPERCCNNGCTKKKWVCEESVPRCFKQRECVWHYGKEYCRYVRRCHGGGDRYCKWISVPAHNNCGCGRCD